MIDRYRVAAEEGLNETVKLGEQAPKQTIDERAVQDWLDNLSKYTLTVWWEWEDPDVAWQAIKEFNDRAIEVLKANLRGQLKKLEPLPTDPPNVKQMKWDLVHRREQLLSPLDGHIRYVGSTRDDSPAIIGIPQAYFKTDKRKPLINENANHALQQLIRIGQTGDWERTQCSQIAYRCY